jgi:hypothetical protein
MPSDSKHWRDRLVGSASFGSLSVGLHLSTHVLPSPQSFRGSATTRNPAVVRILCARLYCCTTSGHPGLGKDEDGHQSKNSSAASAALAISGCNSTSFVRFDSRRRIGLSAAPGTYYPSLKTALKTYMQCKPRTKYLSTQPAAAQLERGSSPGEHAASRLGDEYPRLRVAAVIWGVDPIGHTGHTDHLTSATDVESNVVVDRQSAWAAFVAKSLLHSTGCEDPVRSLVLLYNFGPPRTRKG